MPASESSFQAVSDLGPQELEWLWDGRVCVGKSGILDGDPGMGKSLIALDLCARLSTGRGFPGEDGRLPTANCGSAAEEGRIEGGATQRGPAAALVVNGEDGAADTVRPRLSALGADLRRVFVPRTDAPGREKLMRFPEDVAQLEAAIAETQAKLVVIDPIMAFLDAGVATSNDQNVRQALWPIAEMAQRWRCAVLLVRHLNKSGGHRALYRGGGSIGIVGACRTALVAAQEPGTSERWLLAQVKNNLGPRQPTLGYRLSSRAGGDVELTWLGESEWTADQVLSEAARRPRSRSARMRAKAFLQKALATGPMTTRELWEKAQAEGIRARTLQHARAEAKVRTEYVTREGRRETYWAKEGQQVPGEDELQAWFREQEEKYGRRTSLDPE